MDQLTAEEVRRTYRFILCARCLRRCESEIADTMEYVDGELEFRVEIHCPNCNTLDTITRKGGILTRTSEGPSITPAEWQRSAMHIAQYGLPSGGQSGIVVRQTDRGAEGGVDRKSVV